MRDRAGIRRRDPRRHERRARYPATGACRRDTHARYGLLSDTTIAVAGGSSGPGQGQAALFCVDAAEVLRDPLLGEELFGAASLVVRVVDEHELRDVLVSLEGQLTATLQIEPADTAMARRLVPLLERQAGPILANGWPTGVEVSYAMVHGGPYPTTSDPRSASVGAGAIERFLRPVCYQDLPDALLPAPVQHHNPLHLPCLVDGTPQP